jgi:4-hydroxyphenylpyruvate dioxygenase-like putative hemolysin
MNAPVPRVHHVVFCVRHQNLDHAAGLWRALGLAFSEVELADLGLKVLIDWNAGVEVIAPLPDAGEEAAPYTAFLDTHGEGFYSVVMDVAEVDGPTALATAYGATVGYAQHREHGGMSIDEVSLDPLHGMAVTFLATGTTGPSGSAS